MPLSNVDIAPRNFFQARDHAKSSRLAATGGANQHDELVIGNFEIHILDRGNVAPFFSGINLVNVIKGDLGHRLLGRQKGAGQPN
jgi:hypothetical protein